MNFVTDQSMSKDTYVLKRIKQHADYMQKNSSEIDPLQLLSEIKQHEFDYDMDKLNREEWGMYGGY